jgi:hypothetical protein
LALVNQARWPCRIFEVSPVSSIRNYSPVIPAKAGIHPADGPSFLRKQESIRIAVNASLPDGFLLSQE